jgi:hypothetical protein
MTSPKETPERVYIKTTLTKDRVDQYWRVLGFSEDYWLKQCSPAQRYEHVIDYLLTQAESTESSLDAIKPLDRR